MISCCQVQETLLLVLVFSFAYYLPFQTYSLHHKKHTTYVESHFNIGKYRGELFLLNSIWDFGWFWAVRALLKILLKYLLLSKTTTKLEFL